MKEKQKLYNFQYIISRIAQGGTHWYIKYGSSYAMPRTTEKIELAK